MGAMDGGEEGGKHRHLKHHHHHHRHLKHRASLLQGGQGDSWSLLEEGENAEMKARAERELDQELARAKAPANLEQVRESLLKQADAEEKSAEEWQRKTSMLGGVPSSFVEVGAPDSFADLDAKLKALEEKTKAELAKLQSDTAAPSSFVEEGAPDSFADLDAKLKALE